MDAAMDLNICIAKSYFWMKFVVSKAVSRSQMKAWASQVCSI